MIASQFRPRTCSQSMAGTRMPGPGPEGPAVAAAGVRPVPVGPGASSLVPPGTGSNAGSGDGGIRPLASVVAGSAVVGSGMARSGVDACVCGSGPAVGCSVRPAVICSSLDNRCCSRPSSRPASAISSRTDASSCLSSPICPSDAGWRPASGSPPEGRGNSDPHPVQKRPSGSFDCPQPGHSIFPVMPLSPAPARRF